MSSIVTAITGGGGSGVGYQAQSAPIQSPATTAQANDQYANANQGLTNQAGFLTAVQAQNGLGNQSSVFNQLQGVTNGTGPNPAQAQLAQATGANVANQAALMAGQRGASQNVGLIARQAAQQGAATQQNAAGQAATLQANQSLNALGQQGSLATSQANQQANATNAYSASAQGEQSNILNSIAGQNQANVANQGNMNSNNAAIANTVAGQQGNLVGNLTGGIGSAFGLAEGGMVPKNYANGGVTTALDTTSGGAGPKSKLGQYFATNQNATGTNPTGPLTGTAAAGNTLGQGIGQGIKAIGNGIGSVGNIFNGAPNMGTTAASGTPEVSGGVLGQLGSTLGLGQTQGVTSDMQDGGSMAAKGGKVPAMVSPGEKYLSPKDVKKVAKFGKNPMEVGETIKGKAKVGGAKNSYANDTVPKTLEEGGVVLPRSVTQAKNPHWEAHKFVKALMAKNGGKI